MDQNKYPPITTVSVRPALEDQLSRLIGAHQFTEVFKLVEGKAWQNDFEKRIMLHYMGVAYIHIGALHKAKMTLLNTKEELGENIAIIRDLACVYYQLGEIDLWRNTYTKLQRSLEENRAILNPYSRISTSLILAKFFEEEALVARALQEYVSCLEESKRLQATHPEYYIECLSQVVRLKALFRQGENLGAIYTELISLRAENVSKDLEIEVQHSLMLAEMALVGPEHAWSRAESLIHGEISDADRRLAFFDYLEEAMIFQKALPATIRQHFPDMKEADEYECELYRLLFEGKTRDFLFLSHLASEMSLASYLRLLIVYLSMENNRTRSEELKNKINLLLSALDPESRPFWLERMKPFLANSDLTLIFDPQTRRLRYQNKDLDLSRKKGMILILASLSETAELSIEDMIHRMWSAPYSPDFYHRLRMTVHRLNQILFELTAVPKVIEISSDNLALKPSIKLKSQSL